jgi:CRP-like cAMP-binding protein
VTVSDAISTLPERSLDAGASLITEGEELRKIYFLKSGRVEVKRDGIRISRIKTPGRVLGEISVLLQSNATADVIATEDSVFYVADDPEEFLKTYPEVNLHVSHLLASRLTAATQYLVDVREQLRDCSDHVGMVDGVLDSILHRDLKKRVS